MIWRESVNVLKTNKALEKKTNNLASQFVKPSLARLVSLQMTKITRLFILLNFRLNTSNFKK